MAALLGAFCLYCIIIVIMLCTIRGVKHLLYKKQISNIQIGSVYYSKECVNNPFISDCSFVVIMDIKKNKNGDVYVSVKDQDGIDGVILTANDLFTYYTTKSKYE